MCLTNAEGPSWRHFSVCGARREFAYRERRLATLQPPRGTLPERQRPKGKALTMQADENIKRGKEIDARRARASETDRFARVRLQCFCG
jgi:hypothetical protein